MTTTPTNTTSTLEPNPIAAAFPYCSEASVQSLCVRGTSLAELAQTFDTPLFVYSGEEISRRFTAVAEALAPIRSAAGEPPLICYSVKANSNMHILRMLAELGAGFDIVSRGELKRALEAGARPENIVFAGVGKADEELREAIRAEVGLFNVESVGELERLQAIAAELGREEKSVRVALRLNPDVDPETHSYITTGKKENKFGIDLAAARRQIEAWRYPHLALVGVHLHIGSQIRKAEKYTQAIESAAPLLRLMRELGHPFDRINLGGGFGVDYTSAAGDFQLGDYTERVQQALDAFGKPRLLVEPGRFISAPAGLLLTRVLYVKPAGPHRFYVVDGAMNDLMRPSLYAAYHAVWPVTGHGAPPEDLAHADEQAKEAGAGLANVVGPICESGDFLALGRKLPELERGNLLAVFHAGAYGFTMASNYNTRPRPAEVLVQPDGTPKLIRRRETYDDLLAPEREV